jgi:hypothetical protein
MSKNKHNYSELKAYRAMLSSGIEADLRAVSRLAHEENNESAMKALFELLCVQALILAEKLIAAGHFDHDQLTLATTDEYPSIKLYKN